jgi:pimeloyl-ACP methyl ester carboxylesterase
MGSERISTTMRVSLCLVMAIGMSVSAGQAQHLLAGQWEGAITLGGFPLGIRVLFRVDADSLRGTIDIPQQMAKGLELRNVSVASPKVHFELPAGPGVAVFDGTVRGDSLSGDFRQAGFTGRFELVRRPDILLPYRVEEVNFFSDTVALAGTMTLPIGPGPYPAILLIAGSGAQTRDEEVFGFPVFQILSDSLTRHGFGVLRYDKRGTGSSTGDLMSCTVYDLAGDVLAGIRFLKTRSDIDTSRIALLGHSEGSAVAMVVASGDRAVATVVVLGGAAVCGDTVILEAVHRQELERQMSSLTPDQKKSLPSADSLARLRVGAELAAMRSPWYRQFLKFDPAEVIGSVSCPVLAIYGGKDVQVSADLNRGPMEAALQKGGNSRSRVVVIPDANHLFQEARTGIPAEYGMLKKEFAAGLTGQIVIWLNEQLAP